MVVWFFVGALCKRPWRWKRLNCYVAACAAFFVAVPRFFAGHSPCAPDAGNLFPHPSFRTVEHVFPYSIFAYGQRVYGTSCTDTLARFHPCSPTKIFHFGVF